MGCFVTVRQLLLLLCGALLEEWHILSEKNETNIMWQWTFLFSEIFFRTVADLRLRMLESAQLEIKACPIYYLGGLV